MNLKEVFNRLAEGVNMPKVAKAQAQTVAEREAAKLAALLAEQERLNVEREPSVKKEMRRAHIISKLPEYDQYFKGSPASEIAPAAPNTLAVLYAGVPAKSNHAGIGSPHYDYMYDKYPEITGAPITSAEVAEARSWQKAFQSSYKGRSGN